MKKEEFCDNCVFGKPTGEGRYKNYCPECGEELKWEERDITTEMLDPSLWTVRQIEYQLKYNLEILKKTIQILFQGSQKG